jgi:UDPglucose 6-dehydrogenase
LSLGEIESLKDIVAVLGLGYVGLTMVVSLAKKGIETMGVDVDRDKIKFLIKGKSPIYEPGFEELINEGLKAKKLRFTDDHTKALKESKIIFICVGTPAKSDGSISLEQIESVSECIGESLKEIDIYKLIVIRSTIIPGTSEGIIKHIIEEKSGKSCGADFGLCMNPEFLREGSAVQDMLKPDRIIIGQYDNKSGKLLENFYRNLYSQDMPKCFRTSLANAELIKYANNTFLATKVSFINSIANLCEKIPDTDVEAIAEGIGLDPRIAPLFFRAGLGWGGSCFPKDLKAILAYARNLDLDLPIIEATLKVNESQPLRVVNKARELLGNLKGRKIAILGLAFKPNTDDIREAVSIKIIEELMHDKAEIRAYDPKAMKNFRKKFGEKIAYMDSAKECIKDTVCCIIVTEWHEFKDIKPEYFKKVMKRPLVIDGRRLYDAGEFSNKLEYFAIGLGSSRLC